MGVSRQSNLSCFFHHILSYKCSINIDLIKNILNAGIYSALMLHVIFHSLILAFVSLSFFRDPDHVRLSYVTRPVGIYGV